MTILATDDLPRCTDCKRVICEPGPTSPGERWCQVCWALKFYPNGEYAQGIMRTRKALGVEW